MRLTVDEKVDSSPPAADDDRGRFSLFFIGQRKKDREREKSGVTKFKLRFISTTYVHFGALKQYITYIDSYQRMMSIPLRNYNNIIYIYIFMIRYCSIIVYTLLLINRTFKYCI